MTGASRFWAACAVLPGGIARDVLFTVAGGRFVAVTPGTSPGEATRLPGIVLPGFANVHSHAFHRALRGRTHDQDGTFWTWRDAMYAVAQRLDPDSYLALARAAYAEMALAGVVAVGEFHYLHHGPDGRRYADPNVMAHALHQAAVDAGIRLTLLDTCYLSGGLGRDGHLPLDPVQRRFSDGDVDAWAARVGDLRDGGVDAGFVGDVRSAGDTRLAGAECGVGAECWAGAAGGGLRVGVAVHSVRAVPRAALGIVAAVAAGRPLHVHLSEQVAENDACLAHHGLTPTALLVAEGALGPTATAVHATHLTAADVALLGRAGTGVCLCPTTERDLADGIGPARALHDAGVRLSLGTDQHAVVDLFEEARACEMHERLRSGRRGRFSPAELLAAVTGHASLGWADAGRLAAGARTDLVAVRTDSVRTSGGAPEQILLTATAADVDTVIVDGQVVVAAGRHRLGDVATLLRGAIKPLWEDR